MFYNNSWIRLPHLPMVEPYKRMELPSALFWMPGDGLTLVGGCWFDYKSHYPHCTNKIWKLLCDRNINWEVWPENLGKL